MQKIKQKTRNKKTKTTTNVKEHGKYTQANIYTYIYRCVDRRKFWQVFFFPFISKPRFGFLSISY